MSREALLAALGPAFDPEPPPSELAACHTPYVAETSPALAPIYLNFAAEDHDKVSSPRGFLELLVSHLADAAAEATGGGARQQDRLLARRAADRRPGRGGARAHAEARRELAGVGVRGQRSRQDAPAARGLPHDRADGGAGQRGARRHHQLYDFALVVAIHDDYREREGYAELVSGRIEHHLEVPELTDAAQLGTIVDTRASFLLRDAGDPQAGAYTRADLLTPAALEELFALHVQAQARSLRRTLATARSAIGLAVDEPAALVDARHVRAAASDT